ncbi:ABC transporter permease [Streptococcus sp. 121]|uniref:ABC transporter permease n=1 Tax=Streptococcus sp. 121 TaxID=2797637 RepID=UPI0018F0CD6F|nr:ABC transporter permease [Streptococcus sp. 121]MBJ6745618.1 ABC transporter permease [Streptococcus sp. 121]
MTSKRQQLLALMSWSYIRNRNLLLLCCIFQLLMTLALTFGYSQIIPQADDQINLYLASGAITMGMVTIGTTIAPQSLTKDKENGLVTYVKTLPVNRELILLSDILIWSLSAIPGVCISFLVVFIKFRILPTFSWSGLLVLYLILVTMISLGFSIAYATSPSLTILMTQIILMIGLLFAPILYPAERIPAAILAIYQFLPFVPSGDLIRNTFFQNQDIAWPKVGIVVFWLLTCSVISLKQLKKRF